MPLKTLSKKIYFRVRFIQPIITLNFTWIPSLSSQGPLWFLSLSIFIQAKRFNRRLLVNLIWTRGRQKRESRPLNRDNSFFLRLEWKKRGRVRFSKGCRGGSGFSKGLKNWKILWVFLHFSNIQGWHKKTAEKKKPVYSQDISQV